MTWWNPAWTKKKPITLTGGASGSQSAYQLKLIVAYDSDMKSDFSDLRFTNGAEDALIDSWLESKTDDTSAVIWVEFPTTPANNVDQTYYMYYGNSGAASDWDIRSTMLDGDDFPGTSLDATIWGNQECTVAVSGGILTLDTFTTALTGGLKGKRLISPSCVIESRCKNVYTGDEARIGTSNLWSFCGDDAQTFGLTGTNVVYGYTYNEGAVSYCGTTSYTVDQYYNIKIVNDGVGNVRFYLGSTEVNNSPVTSNIPDENMYLRIYGSINDNPTIKMDWIFARKYAANPATYVFGSENLDWYNWDKWKIITLTGTGDAQTDYQIKLDVEYDSDMKSDFSDLRFTEADGTTLLDAWLESKVDGVSAVIWVETDTPADGETDDIYMYYGNSDAESYWDGAGTFLLFDDFEDNDTSDWSKEAGVSFVPSTDYVRNGTYSGKYSTTSAWMLAYKAFTSQSKVILNCSMLVDTISDPRRGAFFCGDAGPGYDGINIMTDGGTTTIGYFADTYYSLKPAAVNTWYDVECVGKNITQYDIYIDGTLEQTDAAIRDTITNYSYIKIGGDGITTVYVDDIRVRKYTANLPTYVFGGEKSTAGGRYIHRIAGIFGMQYTGRRSW